MVIDKNKPLPPHTKLDFWECYAKIVLEELLPEKFTNLMLADKPDLRDNDGCVGVEVTIADNQKQLEAERLYSTLYYKNEKQKAYAIERIEKLGAKVHDGFMMGIKGTDSFERINKAIRTKCKTIEKGGYEPFGEYHLFMFSSIYAVDYMLQEELEYLIAEDIGKFYRMIYVLIPGGMYCFDLTTNEYTVFDIDSNMQHKQATKARQMVEEGEEMQQGYKQTEIGVIPADWEICVAEDLYLKARIGWQGLKKHEYLDDGDYYLVTGTDFLDNKISLKNCHYVLQERYDQDKNIQLSTGDILITKDGSIGKTAFVDALDKPATLNSGIFLVRPKNDKIDQAYLYFVFKSEYFNKFLKDLTAGSTIVHLYQKDFVAFKYPLPNRKEQELIAKSIIDIDSMISSLEKLIAKKKAVKQGTMQELLTRQKRLPGFSGEWRTINLGEISKIKTGDKNNEQKSEDGKYPFFVRSQQVERINSYSFDGEAILIPGEGNIGQIFHYINGKFDWHQRVYKISDFPNFVCGKYVYYQMKFTFGEHALKNTVKATVDSLRLPTFESFEVLIPPTVEEQVGIATVLSDMGNEIETLEQKLSKTRQIKQGMMQQLLTGKIRFV